MMTKASSSNDTNTKRCVLLSPPPHADSAAHNRHAHTSDHAQPQSTITQREPQSCSVNHANSRKQCGPAPSNKARRVPSESTRGHLSAVQSSHETSEITTRTRSTKRGKSKKMPHCERVVFFSSSFQLISARELWPTQKKVRGLLLCDPFLCMQMYSVAWDSFVTIFMATTIRNNAT